MSRACWSVKHHKDRGGCWVKKQTFIIEVNDTQNQSWQGQIEWIQGHKKESFRSVMELLQLMDSAVYEKGRKLPADDLAE